MRGRFGKQGTVLHRVLRVAAAMLWKPLEIRVIGCRYMAQHDFEAARSNR